MANHTLRVEKKPLLSLLSIESSSGNQEGGGDQQMMPKLLNEEFSAKVTRQNTIENPIKLCFRRRNEVGSRFCGNRQMPIARSRDMAIFVSPDDRHTDYFTPCCACTHAG
jgi:hypothetical protein